MIVRALIAAIALTIGVMGSGPASGAPIALTLNDMVIVNFDFTTQSPGPFTTIVGQLDFAGVDAVLVTEFGELNGGGVIISGPAVNELFGFGSVFFDFLPGTGFDDAALDGKFSFGLTLLDGVDGVPAQLFGSIATAFGGQPVSTSGTLPPNAVPEPATAVLCGLGLAMLGARRRR